MVAEEDRSGWSKSYTRKEWEELRRTSPVLTAPSVHETRREATVRWPAPSEGLQWKCLHACRQHYEEAGMWRTKEHEKEYWGSLTAFELPEDTTIEELEDQPGFLSRIRIGSRAIGIEDLVMDAVREGETVSIPFAVLYLVDPETAAIQLESANREYIRTTAA